MILGWVAKEVSKLRLKTAARTDERIRTMNEIVTGIRVIKVYTWEKPFATLIHLCRKYDLLQFLVKSLKKVSNAPFKLK